MFLMSSVVAAPVQQSSRPKTQSTPAASSAHHDEWKSKHDEFQQSIQYAKKMAAMQKAGVNIASLPPPPPSLNPDYIQCNTQYYS